MESKAADGVVQRPKSEGAGLLLEEWEWVSNPVLTMPR